PRSDRLAHHLCRRHDGRAASVQALGAAPRSERCWRAADAARRKPLFLCRLCALLRPRRAVGLDSDLHAVVAGLPVRRARLCDHAIARLLDVRRSFRSTARSRHRRNTLRPLSRNRLTREPCLHFGVFPLPDLAGFGRIGASTMGSLLSPRLWVVIAAYNEARVIDRVVGDVARRGYSIVVV